MKRRDYAQDITDLVRTPKVILSLGAGVQSSTLALMCATGELPYKIDAAIFADTMAEPAAVYEWLAWLENQLPFPVIRVSKGDLEADGLRMWVKASGEVRWKSLVPTFTTNKTDGSHGKHLRKCTYDYKILEIVKKQRELVGKPVVRAWQRAYGVRRERVGKGWVWRTPEGTPVLARCLIGISLDEINRVKASRLPWIENVYPLAERAITRQA